SSALTSVLSAGDQITFPSTGMTATFLEGQTVTIVSVSGSTFAANFTHANYGPTSDTGTASEITYSGTPISGSVLPTWSTVVPAAGNDYQGGITIDGSVQWTNRGNPIENWGIANDAKAVVPVIGSSNVSWRGN